MFFHCFSFVRRAVEPILVQLIQAVRVVDDCGPFAPRKPQSKWAREKVQALEALMDGQ